MQRLYTGQRVCVLTNIELIPLKPWNTRWKTMPSPSKGKVLPWTCCVGTKGSGVVAHIDTRR